MATERGRRPTVRDVADRAATSFKTVSRVVNGEAGVSPGLTARVEAAIAELGYQPDDRARRLRQSGERTAVIGFVLVDVANPFFSALLRGIEEVARQHQCLVLAGSTDGSPDRESQLIRAFVSRRVDGLIVVPSAAGAGPLAAERGRGTPVVMVDLEPDGYDGDVVRTDHHAGVRRATEHLLAHGHRDIACFTDDLVLSSARLRAAGYADALRAAGLSADPTRTVSGTRTAFEWQAVIGRYLDDRPHPTAIVTAQNFITMGAVAALHERGLQRRVAQVGFDDVELADLVEPGITVVPQRPIDVGRRAADVLFARLDGDDGPPRRELLDSPLIARGSGELAI